MPPTPKTKTPAKAAAKTTAKPKATAKTAAAPVKSRAKAKAVQVAPPYTLSHAEMCNINDIDVAFGTTKYLPPDAAIPAEFKRHSNIYSRLAEALIFGTALPAGELQFLPGFTEPEDKGRMVRCVRAHLTSYSPKHEHKIAGVAFMISKMCVLIPEVKDPEAPKA